MEIVEYLVEDDLVSIGDKLYVAKHLFVSNETASVVRLECVNGD